MTMFTRSMSMPRPIRSVATRMRIWPSLKALYTPSLRARVRAALSMQRFAALPPGLPAQRTRAECVLSRSYARTAAKANPSQGCQASRTVLPPGSRSRAALSEHVRGAHRSSCFMPRWMQMDGKLHSTSSLFSSLARSTDFTKITTCPARRWSASQPGSQAAESETEPIQAPTQSPNGGPSAPG